MTSETPQQERQETPQSNVFDVSRVRELVELMRAHDLSEIDLQAGDMRIRLRRGGEAASVPATPIPMPIVMPGMMPPAAVPTPGAPQPAAPPTPPPQEREPTPSPPKEENIAFIRSPMVGTFYAAPDPDSPPYVKVGDHVNPETIVGIVEAMKVFNEIPAEISGKIVAVLVESGEPVEYGQPLFKIDTRG